MRRTAILVVAALLTVFRATPAPANAETGLAKPKVETPAKAKSAQLSLEALFAAIEKDPSKVVPLIQEASARISESPTAESHALAERLRPVLKRAFESSETFPEMSNIGLTEHKIREGDRPSKIAARYHFDASLLPKLNRKYDPRRLIPGKKLKVIDLRDDSLRLVIDRTNFRIAVWHTVNGKRILTGYYPVAIGAADSPTPTGATRIASHVKDPSWRDPKTKRVYGPGHKKNVLGGYWMGLSSKGLGKKGIGIHGYSGSPPKNWIGKRASHGCIRLLDSDIRQVFALARVGNRVTIQ